MSDVGREKLVGTVAKNRKERVQLSLSEYRGREMLNLRIWYLDEDDSWKPGKQGLAIRVELLPELRSLMQEAERVARELHLLPSHASPRTLESEEVIARRSTKLGETVFGSPKSKGGGG